MNVLTINSTVQKIKRRSSDSSELQQLWTLTLGVGQEFVASMCGKTASIGREKIWRNAEPTDVGAILSLFMSFTLSQSCANLNCY